MLIVVIINTSQISGILKKDIKSQDIKYTISVPPEPLVF